MRSAVCLLGHTSHTVFRLVMLNTTSSSDFRTRILEFYFNKMLLYIKSCELAKRLAYFVEEYEYSWICM